MTSLYLNPTKISFHAALFSGTYHFSAGISGLAYLGLGIGFFIASGLAASLGNVIYKKVFHLLLSTQS